MQSANAWMSEHCVAILTLYDGRPVDHSPIGDGHLSPCVAAIIDAQSSRALDTMYMYTTRDAYGGLRFHVSKGALKLKSSLPCEIFISIYIFKTKHHTSFQYLASIHSIKTMSGAWPGVTHTTHGGRRGTGAHVRKT